MKSIKYLMPLTGIVLVFLTFLSFTMCSSADISKKSQSKNQDSPETIQSNTMGNGAMLEITFMKGKAHNHPTFVFWLEDLQGNYLQTLYITQAIGQGIFAYGDKTGGAWKPGEVRRPAALPYWAHKRGVLNEDGLLVPTTKNKIPDAYSGATPKGSFKLLTRSDDVLKGKVNLMFEINQTWDWNEFWNNSKYPENADYKTSCQPALVYKAEVDFDKKDSELDFKVLGHSHFAGQDGSLTSNIETITTALQITKDIKVKIVNR